MTNNRGYTYDVCFVVLSSTLTYPPGGLNVVWLLALHLSQRGYKVAVISPIDYRKYLYRLLNDSRFLPTTNREKLRSMLLPLIESKFGKKFLLPAYRKIKNIDYNYSKFDSIPFLSFHSFDDITLECNNIIAVSWQSAYFVNEYLRKHHSKGWYIIYHSEDDPSFSGIFSGYATKTYEFPLRKLAVNAKICNRFRSEHPRLFTLGYDSDRFKLMKSISEREDFSLVLPLRQGEHKGAKVAIAALEMLHIELPNLSVVSYGTVSKRDIPDFVTHYESPPTQLLVKLLNESAIFVLPSLVEGFAHTVLEAMSCGCAIISTFNGGVEDYVLNEVNGLLIPPNDPVAIKEAVKRLCLDKELRIQLAQNGLNTTKSFSYQRMFSEFERAIDFE